MKVVSPCTRSDSITEKVFRRVYSNFNISTVDDHDYTHTRRRSSDYGKMSLRKRGFGEKEEVMEMEQMGAERIKTVLILMSDTGGGHRASAEAIRDAFKIEFGDDYRVNIYIYYLFIISSSSFPLP